MEDRRAYDPLLAGRTASSPDPWLRAKTALAAGRLRDPNAHGRPAAAPDRRRTVREARGRLRRGRLGRRSPGALSSRRRSATPTRDGRRTPPRPSASSAARTRRMRSSPRSRGGRACGARTRAASALAMFRRPEARTVPALVSAFGEEPLAPDLRRAIVYSLARKPQPVVGARASCGSSNEGRGGGGSLERRTGVGGAGIGDPRRRGERGGPRPPRGQLGRFDLRAVADGALFTFQEEFLFRISGTGSKRPRRGGRPSKRPAPRRRDRRAAPPRRAARTRRSPGRRSRRTCFERGGGGRRLLSL